jgi:hypothetical protein
MSKTRELSPRKLEHFFVKQCIRLSDVLIGVVEYGVPFLTQQALRYCDRYGHSFVTYLNGRDVCATCHLSEDIALSIQILEK